MGPILDHNTSHQTDSDANDQVEGEVENGWPDDNKQQREGQEQREQEQLNDLL